MAKARLQIIPLGGLGEIGKNMTVFRYGDEIIVIDAGMAFPEEDMLGIDIVIPDFSYLIENKDKIKAILITHGHEDHIGSLSYLLRDVSAPVYATRLTCGLIEGKLKEAHISNYDLHVVKSGDEFKAGSFKFGFFHVCHSIPDSCGIYLRTPIGTIVHTGDFKFDHSPVDGEQTDMYKLAELGHRGVLVLCADSTNAQNPGYTPSEAVVTRSLMEAYGEARGRIILATFASNVSRIQMAVDAAVHYKRKVCVFGRSMVNVVNIALEMGYLTAPEGTFIEPEEINRYRDDRLCILTTGSQGEPMSALTRIAFGEHRKVNIGPNDYVIISATPIPGNEKMVGNVVNELMKHNVEVIYEKMYEVHVSGHACQEELKLMMGIVKPQYFIPVHGEQKHLQKHAGLAMSMGYDMKHIYLGNIGEKISLSKTEMKQIETVPAGEVYVDGLGVGDVGNIVLNDRKHLSQDGIIIVVATLDAETGDVVSGPDVVSRGVVYVKENEDLMNKARDLACHVIYDYYDVKGRDWNTVKSKLRDEISHLMYEKTKRSPMVIPMVTML